MRSAQSYVDPLFVDGTAAASGCWGSNVDTGNALSLMALRSLRSSASQHNLQGTQKT
jgi:hypothetical protein